ncbi:MAG: hypothetical protein JW852_09390 [Spirochaetales bacterium]|nr:hypothetical protein [Spirochaetales bacterium]
MAGIAHGKRSALLASAIIVCLSAPAHGNIRGIGLSAFLDGSWVFPVGLAFYPGVELPIRSFDVKNNMVLTLGAAVPGQVAYAEWKDAAGEELWSFTTFGVAAAPLLLLSFDDGNQDNDLFRERIEFSLSPGLGFNYYIYAGDPAFYVNRKKLELGFIGFAGTRFHIGRFVALRFDATYWGRYIGANIALGLQLALW